MLDYYCHSFANPVACHFVATVLFTILVQNPYLKFYLSWNFSWSFSFFFFREAVPYHHADSIAATILSILSLDSLHRQACSS